MVREQVDLKIKFILFGKNSYRPTIEYDEYGELIITVELHGLTVSETKKIINGILLLINEPFTLKLIHGYNHGTALKEYIHKDLHNKRIVEKYCYPYNPGETILTIV